MPDDAKNWITVKVPEQDKARADEQRPESATYGDCLRAGAEVLAGERWPPEQDISDSLADLRAAVEAIEGRIGKIEQQLEGIRHD